MDRRRMPPNIQLPVYSPSDLTSALPVAAGNPARSDAVQTPGHQKRRQTLLTILDALNELRAQGLDNDSTDGMTFVDDETGGPSAEEQVQNNGAEAFNRFQRRVQQLDKELQYFANAVRQLGSSVRLLSSSFHLRQRLLQVLFLFRENAAELFPRQIERERRELDLDAEVKRRIQRNQTRRREEKVPSTRPIVRDNLTLESFPAELELLAADVTIFLECLNEFPEFTDEAVNASVLIFEGDLKYWASCLKEFKGRFVSSGVRRYVHDLSGEMGDRIDSITSTISVFVEVGVPTIRFAQKHGATNLLNLSTVATFFSAVTATTLQFSFDKLDGPQQNAVNAFWFSSLVFSIASAVNSLLGLTWKQAIYRSPRHRVPWWVIIWIKRSPLIFLVVSVAAFSIGLVLFTWASNQHLTTCIVTTMFTGFSSFGLLAVSAWFAFERVTYNRHKGKRWLADVLVELHADFRRHMRMERAGGVLPRFTGRARSWGGSQASRFARASTAVAHAASRALARLLPKTVEDDPRGQGDTGPSFGSAPFRLSDPAAASTDSPSLQADAPPSDPAAPPPDIAGDADTLAAMGAPAKGSFASAVRSVIMLQKASTAASSPLTPPRKLGLSAVVDSLASSPHGARDAAEPFTAAKLQRLITLSRALKNVYTMETLPAHQALVRHLQFSPDGKWLATCSWDRTGVLFKVGNGEPFTSHRILSHLEGFVHQVAWAPKGRHLLTRLHSCVKVWTEDGVCIKTIERHRAVQSVIWLSNGKEFLSVEGSEVNKVDLTGETVEGYFLPRLALHDVAVTPDEKRILGVATLIESPDGLQPRKARREKRIVLYNLAEKAIENQVPVLHNVRVITITKNGRFALVSYEDKAPPQLWRLHKVDDRFRLSLRHTYMPHTDVQFTGSSYFGGKDDQLVSCAGRNGHIHIWDRESAVLLHNIRVPEADLTGIAWNTASDIPMFATGSHGGAVKIWSSPLQQSIFSDSRSQLSIGRSKETPDSDSIGASSPPGEPNGVELNGQLTREVGKREDQSTTVSFTSQNHDTGI